MEFRTQVNIEPSAWKIAPCEDMLFVGSCFADNMGRRFREEKFRAVVNPYGVMYNPASVLHTVRRFAATVGESVPAPQVVVLTLGTNHVYILKETGEIVDNCMKRPQRLFTEKALDVDECTRYLAETVDLLRQLNPKVKVIFTVSPIRYRKYGYHGSQLSKATLLLAVDRLLKLLPQPATADEAGAAFAATYFPAYELLNDELRDYRFYDADMLHPSRQAVDYIWERFAAAYFGADTNAFLAEWKPIRDALAHKPFSPESAEYKAFMDKTMLKVSLLSKKYPKFAL